MTTYDFELTDFALSDKGIHLLRNRFNYKTIAYQDLDKAVAKRAVEIKNVALALICGLALTSFAFFQIKEVYDNFNDPTVYKVYVEMIVLPVFPAFVGAYLLYKSIRKGPVLEIEYGKVKHKLRLRDIVKTNQSPDIKEYLSKRLEYRFVDEYEL